MLGGSDDLAAVMNLLDKLSTELETNRLALNETCTNADELGGGAVLSAGVVDEVSVETLQASVNAQNKDCEDSRQALESVLKQTMQAAGMLRALSEYAADKELDLRRTAARDLLTWQIEVDAAEAENAELVARTLGVSSELSKLYGHVRP